MTNPILQPRPKPSNLRSRSEVLTSQSPEPPGGADAGTPRTIWPRSAVSLKREANAPKLIGRRDDFAAPPDAFPGPIDGAPGKGSRRDRPQP
jgi:hypothetical protein